MQVSVTRKKKTVKGKTKIKSIISTILIFLFAFISTAILITVKKKNLVYEERFFYLVSATSEPKESLLETKRELLKNLGAANTIYKKGDKYHLIVNVYLELESAEEIKENLLKYFPDAKIIKLKSKRILSKSIKKIKESFYCEKLVEKLYLLSKDFQILQMNYLSGKSSQAQFLNDLVEAKLELSKIDSQIESDDNYHKKIANYGDILSIKLTNFLAGFDVSRAKQNYICNYFVGFYLDFIEFYESL